jgi:hypothetical protein|tara:strand:+ start:6403 stop:6846 length:444 start_codon:yes stop_codon:yes gene_type:complete
MLVDSKKKQLGEQAIMMIAAQETKSPHPASAVYAAMVKEMNIPGTSTVREGNTIFIIHNAEGRVGVFRALNADTARNYLESSYAFIQGAYKMGFDVLVSEFEDPTIMNIFKAISRNPPQEGMGYRAEKTDSGFRVTVKLGPKRPERD